MSELNIWNKLNSEIKNDFGTSALMGNIFAESGLSSINLQNSCEKKCGMNDLQYTQAVDNGIYKNFVNDRFGYGLAQWTSFGRKQGLLNYAKTKNCSIGDENMQIEYVLFELKNSYKSVWNALVNATSVKQASDIVLTQFERPADQSENMKSKRASYGETFFNKYHKEVSKMSNSSLVTYTNISSHKSKRTHVIDTITIHCYVGQVTAKRGCDYFATTDRSASSNYVVGYDGSIGLSVPEDYRAYTSSNATNDNRAITIEVASDTVAPYKVTDKAYNSLINLVADVCKRNGIKELKWKADKSLIGKVEKQNMTVHRWFALKSCPGDYLYNLHGDIANRVNAKLGISVPTQPSPTTSNISIAPINVVKGNPQHFQQIVTNIKHALNLDYGLQFVLNSTIDDVLLINLGNIVLSTSNYKPNITYALQQLLIWWGYSLTADGILGNGTSSTVRLFQTQIGISATGTTTKEFWYKILGR